VHGPPSVNRTPPKPNIEGVAQDLQPNGDGAAEVVDFAAAKAPGLQAAGLTYLQVSAGSPAGPHHVSASVLAEGELPVRGGALAARLPAADPGPPKPILGHVADAANILSLAGLLGSAAGIAFAVKGLFSEAGVCLVLAFLADVYDGRVARRLKNRTNADRAFGANLDSLIDVVGAGVVPGVILLSYGGFAGWYVPGAFIMLGAAALRLSYFNVNGLGPTASHYTGLPTDLVILTFAALMLLDAPLERGLFCVVLYGGVIALSGLMVSPLKVRKLEGGWYYGLPMIAGLIGVAHLVRALA
jgi:phosphatidylserine synthase